MHAYPRSWCGTLLMAVAVAVAGAAEAAAKDVEWVRPRIGQRGTTVEVVIQGMYLADPQDLVFYKPGIRAVRV